MERPIITDPKFLRQKSEKTDFWESRRIIKDLEDTLKKTKTGIGLTGIQIGIPKRVSILRIAGWKLNLVNPEITEKEQRIRIPKEACLSFPGLEIDTVRYFKIRIKNDGHDLGWFENLQAVAIQHEIDHMNGLTILNRKWRKRR